MSRREDPLWQAVRLLEIRPSRALLAVLVGSVGLGSAVGLAAVSAWLIARAAQMPPLPVLYVAVVAVRTLGISRGVLRYVDRLVSHDLALRGMGTLRERLYQRLAERDPARLLALRRGDVLARVGSDVDAVGEVVVRGLLPMAVAAVLGGGSVVLLAAFLPAAGASLAACYLLAAVVAPWWAVRAARTAEERSAAARVQVSATTMTLLDGAGELLVSGRVPPVLAELRRAERELARATDAAARPAAVAAAIGPLAIGLAVLASLVLGVPATTAGLLDPVELVVIVLTPLAAFEAAALVPDAAVTVLRSRRAAARVVELIGPDTPSPKAGGTHPRQPEASETGRAAGSGRDAPVLVAENLTCGWSGRPVVSGITVHLTPGRRIAVVGPSGSGKTTLLLTLAGLAAPLSGSVRLDGRPVHRLDRAEAAALVGLTTEDAHVFDTTVLENLRVSRGNVTEAEARSALGDVGLGTWLAGLPDGLDTVLGADASRVSGGERRRLLLARALLSPARLLLLDEPIEHLDTGGATLLAGLLDGTLAPGRGVVVVTHARAGLDAASEVIELDTAGSVRTPELHHRKRPAPVLDRSAQPPTQEP